MAHNQVNQLHSWEVSPTEAVAVQHELRDRVVLQPLPASVRLVAGADISYHRFSDVVYAAIVVLRLPELEVVTTSGIVGTMKFPYIPGLLSFREVPSLLEAWEQLSVTPDVVMLDGQGIAHPRRLGIASHVGLLIDLPTVGCAKTVLTGRYEEPAEQAGSWTPMIHRGETIGAALRTKNRVKPVYVSPGHLSDIPSAIDLTLRCVRGYAAGRSQYRLPEPTRLAHLLVNAMRRGEEWTPPVPAGMTKR